MIRKIKLFLVITLAMFSMQLNMFASTNEGDIVIVDAKSIESQFGGGYTDEELEQYLLATQQISNGDEEGRKLEEELNAKKGTRTVGYDYKLISTTTLRKFGILKGTYKEKIPAGYGKSKSVNFSLTIPMNFKGYDLNSGAAYSMTKSYTGPNGNEKVGEKFATHRLFSAIAYGTIQRNTFNIYSRGTGAFVKTITMDNIVDRVFVEYSQLATIEPATARLTVRSVSTNSTRSYATESYFRNNANSESPIALIFT